MGKCVWKENVCGYMSKHVFILCKIGGDKNLQKSGRDIRFLRGAIIVNEPDGTQNRYELVNHVPPTPKRQSKPDSKPTSQDDQPKPNIEELAASLPKCSVKCLISRSDIKRKISEIERGSKIRAINAKIKTIPRMCNMYITKYFVTIF